ncbi:MAG: epimerase [Burkholderiales bacterium]|jgi:hypothetical protein|nr:epimerase [Burkholderiales bacterium]
MKDRDFARLSLAAVWLGTVVVSLHDGGRAGAALLQPLGLSAAAALAVVWGASAWDGALGLALLLRPSALVYRVAALSTVALTIAATLVLPALWLDPFGALLKNLPVLALLRLLTHEAQT